MTARIPSASTTLALVRDPRDSLGLLGTTLAEKYLVQSIAGEGGFGIVYRGHHLGFDQAIAIKCLKVPPHFTGDARRLFVERFAEEGKLLFRLSEHRSIVRVFDYSVLEISGHTVPYLVLEWLEGTSLDDYLVRRRLENQPPLGELEALQLLRDPIDGLAFAHQMRVAHRDIKPANLFLVRTATGWTTKLLDFGVAKLMEEADHATKFATATSSGFKAFSPQYGAPEQFYSKAYGQTGPWTDVHAIGLVMSELVSTRPALDGSEFGELYAHAVADVRPTPRARGAHVSDAFETLCAATVAREIRGRFRSATELLAAVDAHLARARTPVPEPQPAVATPPAPSRAPLILLAAVAVLGFGIAIWQVVVASEPTVEIRPNPSPAPPVAAAPARVPVDAATPDALERVVAADGASFSVGDAVFVRQGNTFTLGRIDAIARETAQIDGVETRIDDLSPAAGDTRAPVGAVVLLGATRGTRAYAGKVTAVHSAALSLDFWDGQARQSLRRLAFDTGTSTLAAPVRAREAWQQPLARMLDPVLRPPIAIVRPPERKPIVRTPPPPPPPDSRASCSDHCVNVAQQQPGTPGYAACMAGCR